MDRRVFTGKGWLGVALSLILCLALVFSLVGSAATGSASADDEGRTYPVMRPDHETLEEWIEAYNNAPRAYIDREAFQVPSPRGSLSLLSHLKYTPSERDQGTCGNCWAWAGTGCLGIALDVQEGVYDRLSVQYINSCETIAIGKTCCAGGWLYEFADYYTYTGQCIPWSNSNADWQDGDASCDTACGSISTTPNYPITSINEATITTQTVDQATAIANIKNVLNQNRAVWFGFFVPTDEAWNDFCSFWSANGEGAVYDMDKYNGDPVVSAYGHAVLCVGYNDEAGTANDYWIMLNSWGTAGGNRPNGLFRIDMDMAYDGQNPGLGGGDYSFYWQTLDVSFWSVPDITVDPTSFEVTLCPDTSWDETLTIGNDGDGALTYDVLDYETTGFTAPKRVEAPELPPAREPLELIELNPSEPMSFAAPPPVRGAAAELAYDDGTAEKAWVWTLAGGEFAVGFTPSSYPVSLQTARIWLSDGWPDSDHEQFAMKVYDDDGASGEPGTCLGSVNTTATDWGWWDVDISGLGVTITEGDFYIAYGQLSDPPDCEALCADETAPDGRSWAWNLAAWSRVEDTTIGPGDWMIRCVVEEADCGWLSESPTSGTVASAGSDEITVSIDTTGLAAGDYSADIVIDNNDPDEDPTIVPVTLHVSTAPPTEPDITVSPTSFEKTLAPDTTQDYTLNIGNAGDAELTYNITDEDKGGPTAPAGSEESLWKPASMVLEIPLEGSPVEPENTEEFGNGWQNIMTEDFEGAFPGSKWDVYSQSQVDAYWGKDSYNPHNGSWSAYCAKSGADADGVDPPSWFPYRMSSAMVYGPFSLADATDAELRFHLWLDSAGEQQEPYIIPGDYLFWAASIDGKLFSGKTIAGHYQHWMEKSLDFTDIPSLGNVCGQPEVWILFTFSDVMPSSSGQGAFIDDVVLRKLVDGVAPHIDSLSSTEGPVDSRVTISGSNFGPTQGTSIVKFNGINADISTWSDTEIAAWVPNGATTGNVVVHTSQGDSNAVPFTITDSPVDYYAVIVGVADYPGTGNDLDYPDEDAWDVRNALLADANWEESHITMLLDSDATKANIQSAIANMGSTGDGNDLFFFHYSGHGGNDADQPPLDEADGLDEFLAQYDCQTSPIWDDEFAEWLAALPSRKVAVSLDACYSGGQVKASDEGMVRCLAAEGIPGKGDGFVRDIDDIIGGVALAASDEDEYSWDVPALGNGLYTYYFVEGLEGPADSNTDNKISMEEAFNYLEPLVSGYPVPDPQNPQMYDGYPDELVILLSELNNPPNTPSNPLPTNHATGVSINTDLSWTGGDPDAGDTVTYDVCFGTSASPSLVSNDQSATSYDPGTLNNNTKYYWKIVATDNHAASTTGPVWDFTTGGADCPWLDESPTSGNITPGNSDDITVNVNTTGLAPGDYNAEIVIANNDPDEDPTVVPLTLHVVSGADLVVSQKYEEWVNFAGKTYNVTYTVKNQGSLAAGASKTRIYIDAGPYDEYYDCPALDPGASYSNTVGPYTMTGYSDTILVYADPYTAVAESNEDNNWERNMMGLMEGDASLDRHVTILDAILIAQHLVRYRTLDSDQLKCADTLGDDGNVDIGDAIYIARWIVYPPTPLWDAAKDADMLPPVP